MLLQGRGRLPLLLEEPGVLERLRDDGPHLLGEIGVEPAIAPILGTVGEDERPEPLVANTQGDRDPAVARLRAEEGAARIVHGRLGRQEHGAHLGEGHLGTGQLVQRQSHAGRAIGQVPRLGDLSTLPFHPDDEGSAHAAECLAGEA